MAPQDPVTVLNGEVPVVAEKAPNDEPTITELTKDTGTPYDHASIACDVLVIGAGFSGITAIHRFRKLGLKVKCFESGSDFGGVWV